MNYLNRLDVQLSNLPQDLNARTQRIQQLESAIPEITNPVARQGSALLSRVGRNAPGAFGIERRLTEMQVSISLLQDIGAFGIERRLTEMQMSINRL